VIVAALAFLPVAQWLHGDGASGYPALLVRWIGGAASIFLLAAAATLLEHALPSRAEIAGGWMRRVASLRATPWLIALASAVLCAVVARSVFSGRPLHVDAITQAYQATVLASGRLWVPTPSHPEFFSSFLIADIDGRTFSQFPPGWPALLALGDLIGMAWLVGPLLVGVAVLGLHALARALEEPPERAVTLALLFGISPWVQVMGASWMNHLPSLAMLLAGGAALVGASHRGSSRLAAIAGLCFGISLTIRPIDTLVFLVPAGLWFAGSAVQRRQWRPIASLTVGLLLPLAALLWYNASTTGHALQLGYEALWGPAHRLGFHVDPWGTAHTPARGIANVNGYLLDMQGELFASGIPGLTFCLLALMLTRRVASREQWMLYGSGLLLLAYVAYWHRGEFLGPRFLFALAPIAMLWTVRFPSVIRERWERPFLTSAARWCIALTVLSGLTLGWAPRWQGYSHYAPSRRWNADTTLAAAGITNGLILIREPWGAQVLARLWGRGVPHSEAQQLYQQVDTCVLYLAVQDLERFDVTGADAVRELEPLRSDSAAVVMMTGAADSTLRMRPGLPHPASCQRRLREDRQGTQPFASLLLAGAGNNVFARDLQERNRLVLTDFPGRSVFQLRLTRDAQGEVVRSFVPVRPDSAMASWRRDAESGGLAALRDAATAASPPSP
jgi:hypothetical protein